MKYKFLVMVSGSILYCASDELTAEAVKNSYLRIGWSDVKIKKVKGDCNYGKI